MPRDLSGPMITAVTSNLIVPAILFSAVFRSMTVYCWSGVGPLVYEGNTYAGIGDLGSIGDISEGVEVSADGTSVTLSGIDATLLSETLGDVQIGAPATLSLALLDPVAKTILGVQTLFLGTVDQPSISPGVEEFSITLKLENRLANLQRASNRRYTAADQNRYYPDDIAFNWVEQLNDQALRWGS